MNKIGSLKIEKFLEDLGSKSPTPGGGAVAALTGAMAASLVEMVVVLTKTEEIKNLGTKAKGLRGQLLKLSDADSKAFSEAMIAYRSKDKLKIKKALQRAIEVPEKTRKLSEEVEILAKLVAEKGNKNAYSDAKTAVYLARAAQKSANENVVINTKALAALK